MEAEAAESSRVTQVPSEDTCESTDEQLILTDEAVTRKQWVNRSESHESQGESQTEDKVKQIKQWFQWEKSLSIDAALRQQRLLLQRQQTSAQAARNVEGERLRQRVQELSHENYELTRQLNNERIRNRDEDAADRRELRMTADRARLQARSELRMRVRETAAARRATIEIKRLEQAIAEKDRVIAKLEAQKCYLGEKLYDITGEEEGFWNDETWPRPAVSERERGLLQRTSSLSLRLNTLQRQYRLLSGENEQLKQQMELERERPVMVRERDRERQQELQQLRKKNLELAQQTKKLEDKVRSLEKKSKELPAAPAAAASAPEKILERVAPQQQQQQPQQQQKQQQLSKQPWRWREKEAELGSLQRQVTERDREIGRLKDRLRELTKKLKQTESGSQSRGLEWNALSQNSRELESLLKLVSKERLQLERHFVLATQGLQRSAELDVTRYAALEATNVQLRRQVEQLEQLCKEQAEAAQQLSKRQQDREILAERLQEKTDYCVDLESQLRRVIDKNAELTIENSDLRKRAQDLHKFESECRTLRNSLTSVESQCQVAQNQVVHLKEKMAALDNVLRQMREAAEKKKELQKQQADAVNELRLAQAQLGLVSSSSKNADSERAQLSQTIETLQSRIRELERKTELQNVRHDELLLELAALRRNNSSLSTSSLLSNQDHLESRTPSPDSLRYLSNGGSSTARTTPLGQPSTNLDALLELDLAESSFNLRKEISQLTAVSSSASPKTGSSTTESNSDIDKILAKIEQDNRVLAELDKSRATVGGPGAHEKHKTVTFANDDSILHYGARLRRKSGRPSFRSPPAMTRESAAYSARGALLSVPQFAFHSPGELLKKSSSAGLLSTTGGHLNPLLADSGYLSHNSAASRSLSPVVSSTAITVTAPGGGRGSTTLHSGHLPHEGNLSLALNNQRGGLAPPLSAHPAQSPLSLPALPLDAVNSFGGPLQSLRHPERESTADMLEIPGKGSCYVYLARYTYDPFTQSPNDNPEAELSLMAGDYVLVWGHMDEDGFFDGELLDGRRGLVPSNFVQRLQGEDLVEFHRAAVLGLQVAGDDSSTTSLPRDLLGFNSNMLPLTQQHQQPVLQYIQQQQQQAQMQQPQQQHLNNEANDQARTTPVAGSSQVAFHSCYPRRPFVTQQEAARQALDWGLMELQEFLEDEELALGVKGDGPVPAPRQLTLERQLNKSILIGWNHPENAPPESGQIACYHVYVDGVLRTTVRATDRPRALIEGVDSNKPHRISVRSVTPRRRASLDAACTMVIGKDVPSAPTCVRVSHVTATSALISWLPANSNHQHAVCVNHVEVRTVKPGVFRHTISGLSPNTVYHVTVKAKNIRAPNFSVDEHTAKFAEKYCTHVQFRTLPKGVPDPPVDVQVETGPQDGTVLVTWLPVTINSQSGKSNGVPVTGYAVYADGKKVTEVDSPTGDHALLDLPSLLGLQAKQITVRTKSRDSQSSDSVPTPIPGGLVRASPKRILRSGFDDPGAPDMSGSASLWTNQTMFFKDVLESDDRPSELSDIAEEPEEYQDYSSEPENVDDAPLRARIGQQGPRDHYLQPVPPGPIPSIEITKDSASERSVEPYRPDPYDRRDKPVAPRREDRSMPPSPRDRENYDGYYDRMDRRAAGVRGRPPPQQQQQQQKTRIFVALFDYDPPTMSPNPDACDEELPFREGQLIKVRGDRDSDGFYWGEVNGRCGYVPSNMVSEVQVDDERVAQELLKDSERDGPGYSRGPRRGPPAAQSRAAQSGNRDRWGDIYANMPVKRMIALYDYDPQELSPNVDAEVELSFQTGDIIYVYGDMDDDGFFLGELRGQRGLVPSNFLTEAPQDYDQGQRDPRQRRQQPSSDRGPPERSREPSYYSRERDRQDRDRDRGVSGAEGPPPPPRSTNQRSAESRDRRRDVFTYTPPLERHEGKHTTLGRDGSLDRHQQPRYTHEDSLSDGEERYRGRNRPRPEPFPSQQHQHHHLQQQPPQSQPSPAQYQNNNGHLSHPTTAYNNGTLAQHDSLPHSADSANRMANKLRGLPAVVPEPGTQAPPPKTGLTSSLFGVGGGLNNKPANNQTNNQTSGVGGGSAIMQKLSGITNENPVEGLLTKGKDLIFKKFGL